MKVVVQIPCFNESDTLPLVFDDMPRILPGVDDVEFLVINDGSTDNTIAVARSLGVHHVISSSRRNRRHLGRAFKCGADYALRMGADIVVNTDGDNQYLSSDIPRLIKPIIEGRADIVIGDRSPASCKEFSFLKRIFQRLGNIFVALATGEKVPDAVSGFRAYSKKALLSLNVHTDYTYTVDTLIQAYRKGLDVEWIAIDTNPKTRESRLIPNIAVKVRKSGGSIVRIATIYQPFRSFLLLSLVFFVPALVLLSRFFYFYFFLPEQARGHVQSVVVGGVCLVVAVQMVVLGILGELLAVNRNLLEDLLTRVKKLEISDSELQDEKVEYTKKRTTDRR